MTINRKDLLLSLRRADILSTPDYQGVTIELKKERAVVSKTTPQLGEVKEDIPAQYTGSSLTIAFNPTYLMDVLRNLEEETIQVSFSGADKPAILRKQGYTYLVLPMKI